MRIIPSCRRRRVRSAKTTFYRANYRDKNNKRLTWTYSLRDRYWDYNLVWSIVLCSKMHLFQKTNISIKVLSAVGFYSVSSLIGRLSNSVSEKRLFFRGRPSLGAIFDFCEKVNRAPVKSRDASVGTRRAIIRSKNVWRIRRAR